VLEAVINGRYCWVPYSRVSKLTMEEPEDLRDAVWMPANLEFTNGGEVVALIPTRYPDTELASGDLCALARRTEWKELPSGLVVGLGQRLLATDSAEFALMDVRSVVLAAADA